MGVHNSIGSCRNFTQKGILPNFRLQSCKPGCHLQRKRGLLATYHNLALRTASRSWTKTNLNKKRPFSKVSTSTPPNGFHKVWTDLFTRKNGNCLSKNWHTKHVDNCTTSITSWGGNTTTLPFLMFGGWYSGSVSCLSPKERDFQSLETELSFLTPCSPDLWNLLDFIEHYSKFLKRHNFFRKIWKVSFYKLILECGHLPKKKIDKQEGLQFLRFTYNQIQ